MLNIRTIQCVICVDRALSLANTNIEMKYAQRRMSYREDHYAAGNHIDFTVTTE